jgi:membrane protein DedA with SNARE-associated domain
MLELLSSSGFAYALIAAFVAADGVFPAIPGETALISGTLLAADGHLSLAAVIAAGVIGGFAGDNASYLLGARLGRPLAGVLARGEKGQRRLDWARGQIEERGSEVIIGMRFVPVGRTASTFACGLLEMPWRRFAVVDAVAVSAWTLFACSIGFWAGRSLGVGGPEVIAIALVLAVSLGTVGELTHQVLNRRRAHRARLRGEAPGDAAALLSGDGRGQRSEDLRDPVAEQEVPGLDEAGTDVR